MSPSATDESQPRNGVKRGRSKYTTRACNPCRKRKTRCDGERPSCGICIVHEQECSYDTGQDKRRPISKAYVAALEDRIAFLEGVIESRNQNSEDVDVGEDDDGELPRGGGVNHDADKETLQPAVDCLQIDDGEIREYGPTSIFKHLPSTGESPESPSQSVSTCQNTHPAMLDGASMKLPDGFTENMHRESLWAFFTFFNPWCWWVDEKHFRNEFGNRFDIGVRSDIHTPYYSPLLHSAVLAIGVMYLETSYSQRALLANTFASNATLFFETEIERAKISTVLGLMLLGSHHAGHARQNLGYIYSGTGLRLTRILGLGIDASPWVEKGVFDSRTKRSRDRVWWTAFVQDKLWSTYVGRAPAPNLTRGRVPFPIVDEGEDATPWGGRGVDIDEAKDSWVASGFAWTCKLARIIELILTHIYATSRTARSQARARNSSYELSVLLEKWHQELPEPLRVSLAKGRSQAPPNPLPHVLVLNVMFNFAVILLNRPGYCDKSVPLRLTARSPSATNTKTAAERCNQAASAILLLAESFDRNFGLRYAPVSMTQFVFTAGTIHLLHKANSMFEPETCPIQACINILHSMGRTWKCASQSGDMLQNLLDKWNPRSKGAQESIATGSSTRRESGKASAVDEIDMQQMLHSHPDVAKQLQDLGWAPPQSDIPPPDLSGFSPDLETLLRVPTYGEAGALNTTTTETLIDPFGSANDFLWIPSSSTWSDYSYAHNLPPNHDQMLLDLFTSHNGMMTEPWFNAQFHVSAEAPDEGQESGNLHTQS